MSTELRYIAQAPVHSPVRAKFFLALDDVSTRESGVVSATGVLETIMTEAAFSSATNNGSITQYHLYRDLGRQVTIVDAAGNHLQKWRQVQHVSGAGSEGVGGTAPEWGSNLYVLVWAADGQNVNVVRTG